MIIIGLVGSRYCNATTNPKMKLHINHTRRTPNFLSILIMVLIMKMVTSMVTVMGGELKKRKNESLHKTKEKIRKQKTKKKRNK
jgi:hypothetical protein